MSNRPYVCTMSGTLRVLSKSVILGFVVLWVVYPTTVLFGTSEAPTSPAGVTPLSHYHQHNDLRGTRAQVPKANNQGMLFDIIARDTEGLAVSDGLDSVENKKTLHTAQDKGKTDRMALIETISARDSVKITSGLSVVSAARGLPDVSSQIHPGTLVGNSHCHKPWFHLNDQCPPLADNTGLNAAFSHTKSVDMPEAIDSSTLSNPLVTRVIESLGGPRCIPGHRCHRGKKPKPKPKPTPPPAITTYTDTSIASVGDVVNRAVDVKRENRGSPRCIPRHRCHRGRKPKPKPTPPPVADTDADTVVEPTGSITSADSAKVRREILSRHRYRHGRHCRRPRPKTWWRIRPHDNVQVDPVELKSDAAGPSTIPPSSTIVLRDICPACKVINWGVITSTTYRDENNTIPDQAKDSTTALVTSSLDSRGVPSIKGNGIDAGNVSTIPDASTSINAVPHWTRITFGHIFKWFYMGVACLMFLVVCIYIYHWMKHNRGHHGHCGRSLGRHHSGSEYKYNHDRLAHVYRGTKRPPSCASLGRDGVCGEEIVNEHVDDQHMTLDGANDGWPKWLLHKHDGRSKPPQRPPTKKTSLPRIPTLKLPRPIFSTVRKANGMVSEASMVDDMGDGNEKKRTEPKVKWSSAV